MSVGGLAAVAGLSAFHFSRLFTAQIGESVMSHVRRKRMLYAAARLLGDRPPALAELAFDCGFESQEAFTRCFKQVFSVTLEIHTTAAEVKAAESAVAKIQAGKEPKVFSEPQPGWCAP